MIKKMPVFLNQDRKATAALDANEHLILFFPDNVSGYSVVHPDILADKDVRKFLSDKIKITTPSLKDQIYMKILPLYNCKGKIDNDNHFKKFFNYYCHKCMNCEDEEFITLIKDCEFLTYYGNDDPQPYRDKASSLYLPTPELIAYFEVKPDIHFIALDKYMDLVGPSKEKQLLSFLSELGIKKEIEIKTIHISRSEAVNNNLPTPNYTRYITWEERVIVGCKENVHFIVSNRDREKSILLWQCLLSVIRTERSRGRSLSNVLNGTCNYFYRWPQQEPFLSSDAICLKQEKWLVDLHGDFVSSHSITREQLLTDYDTNSPEAQELLTFLGIPDAEDEEDQEDDDSNLTPSQRQKMAFADCFMDRGIDVTNLDEADWEKLITTCHGIIRQKEARQQSHTLNTTGGKSYTPQADDIELAEDSFLDDFDDFGDLAENTGNESETCRIYNKTTSDVIRDIVRRAKEYPSAELSDEDEPEDDVDQDELMPSPVDYDRQIEKAKKNSAEGIRRIANYKRLQELALGLPKYSFGWFKALLEMESLSSGEANSRNKEVSISFAKVEREPDTTRTLILKHPNRYIPQFMEDLADIPLVLHLGDAEKRVAVEVASIQSYSLRVKLRSGADIEGIDLAAVNAATIDAKSPAFLLKELRKQFSALEYDDTFDMQEKLCENIEFVFGPPGTGKTTHLAKNVLLPLMKEQQSYKVLVLTPTNKAADVLVRRIMEVSGDDHSYDEWLVRFGATGDEVIEQSPIFRDKTFDIRTISKCVTITTIARFPYDFFMPQGARIYLNEINWDFIVIDEASMIPLANIVYPLYKKTPKKFIIAGDPFQIEPITSVDLWKNENIYTLVKLDSFVKPSTIPHQYKVELLTTQYRSIPEVGGVFSNFAYGGILNHHRESASQRALNIGNGLNIKALNIIKYPVSKYESIYRAKRLQHSSCYQIYSALFTYEYICFISKAIAEANPGSLFKIGIIAPYRAQADLIDKLLSSENLPKEVDVQVGTIHGFQGDECDIIFAVFNTPPTISTKKDMFLNKSNIINVSISRARDYLFIIMPNDETDNIENLRLVKNVEGLIKDTHSWTEALTPDLETLMFRVNNYLENNAFSTSHQSVNVYGLPEKCYEIRTEDNAVDIQIHRDTRRILSHAPSDMAL